MVTVHKGEAHTVRSHRPEELNDLISARTRVGAIVFGEITGYTIGPDGAPNGVTLMVKWPEGSDSSYPVRLSGVHILYPSDA